MSNRWSEDEIDFLKRNYNSMSANELSEKLNRTKQSIYQKVNKLKLDNKVKKPLDMDVIVRMYVNENKSLKEIAKIFNVSEGHLSNILPDNIRKKKRNRLILSKEVLIDLYYDKNLSLKEIGEKFNIDASTVLRIMKEYNLNTRNSYEANYKDLDDDEIVKLYNDGLSCIEIANKFNTSHSTISARLRKSRIPLREHSFYVSGEKSNTERRYYT